MNGRRGFRMDGAINGGSADTMEATAIARQLERYADGIEPEPPEGFADLVMTAIRGEPVPAPTRALGVAVRARRFRSALAALRDAWRVAGSGGRPLAARASAFALILALVVGIGSAGGLAGAGAWNALHRAQPPVVVSSPTPAPSIPTVRVSPTPSETDSDDHPSDSDQDNDDSNPQPTRS